MNLPPPPTPRDQERTQAEEKARPARLFRSKVNAASQKASLQFVSIGVDTLIFARFAI
jgi:hypothetical protein